MNVLLQTNTPSHRLELIDLARHGDQSQGGYHCRLVVEASGFTAHVPCFFESDQLDTFIAQLEAMDATLQGSAILQPRWEDPYFQMEMVEWGHIKVSGDLQYDAQRLQFEFGTDQTVLRPLIADLREIKNRS